MQQLALPEHGPEAEILQIAEVHHAAHISRRHPVFPDAFDGVLQFQGFLFGDAEAFPVEIGLRLQSLPHGVGRDGVDGAGGRQSFAVRSAERLWMSARSCAAFSVVATPGTR